MTSAPPVLKALAIENLCAGYGDTQVLWDVSMRIEPGEIVALIGSNGAGKSTLLAAISGHLHHQRQRAFRRRELTGLEPDRIVRAGVVQVPQGRRLFTSLSVEDNLRMGAYLRTDREVDADLERILTLLPRLRERYTYLAGRLSGGEQQQVAIGRALMARPQVLLIDEMSLGLAPVLVDALIEILAEIHRTGVSILIVEQDVQTALEVSSRAYVLETGRIILTGASSDLLDDPHCQVCSRITPPPAGTLVGTLVDQVGVPPLYHDVVVFCTRTSLYVVLSVGIVAAVLPMFTRAAHAPIPVPAWSHQAYSRM
jgi:branched-chain amino acid transport system ATP-binding protein